MKARSGSRRRVAFCHGVSQLLPPPWRQRYRAVGAVEKCARVDVPTFDRWNRRRRVAHDRSATAAVISPDGTTLAFVAQPASGPRMLYLRRLDQLRAAPLAGTEDAFVPFFSPDGQSLGFFANGRLKKISVNGGVTVTLADARNGRGGAWGEDGTIVFAPDIAPGTPLLRIPAAGGKPEPLTTMVGSEVTHRWPQVLPGGRALLYTAHDDTRGYDAANLAIQPLPTGVPRIVLQGGYHGRYLQSGHLA